MADVYSRTKLPWESPQGLGAWKAIGSELSKTWGEPKQLPERPVPFEPHPEGSYLLPWLRPEPIKKVASALTSQPGVEFAQPLSVPVQPLFGQIKAFHGSPYKFDKFKNEAIGTGEGAQSFGYGHYLTESPEVAQYYAKAPERLWQQIEPNREVAQWLKHGFTDTRDPVRAKGYLESALKNYEDALNTVKRGQGDTSIYELSINNIKKAIDRIDKGLEPPAALYETTIHKGKQPSEYTYLDYDKRVPEDIRQKVISQFKKEGLGSEQLSKVFPPERRLTLEEYAKEYGESPNLRSTQARYQAYLKIPDEEIISQAITDGNLLYGRLYRLFGSQQKASDFLSRAGISGIKYPTGSLSGIKGSKEYNYVVFNPEDITIEAVK